MTSVIRNTFNANVGVVDFAKKFIRLIMNAAKLVIFSNFFLLAGKLEYNKIFGEHIGFNLWVMFISAGGAV